MNGLVDLENLKHFGDQNSSTILVKFNKLPNKLKSKVLKSRLTDLLTEITVNTKVGQKTKKFAVAQIDFIFS